jgi:hypothetical protein
MLIPKLKRGATLAAVALAAAGLAACGVHHRETGPLAKADPSAVVIGTTPVEPTGDPPGTTPVPDSTSDISKSVEQNAMQLPGQPNDHSNLAAAPSQRSDSTDVNRSVDAAKAANSDSSTDKGQQR